ncbi:MULTISPECIES: hypothetical protein [Halorussus]|uniref:hypothetical protein n=1 Tax=Halorussus TaxID=1070314 RepID=UPI000E215C71|nr:MULTISPECIES: hypothetical protein [Halorussus]NHN59819.1 hypothetical protein [Halorussus sp. JP-T4]
MPDEGPRLTKAMTYISTSRQYGGFAESFVYGAGGLVMALFTIIIGIGEAFAGLIIRPTDAFSSVTALLIDAGFGAPARFLQSAWNTAAVALGMDPWLQLGPFLATVAMVAFVATLWVLIQFLDAIDADTPTGINLPFINLDTGGDMEDEND